ncbi:MAG: putative repeat protein (TIGR01451 family), partial [Pirellulaceae bacterium]
TVKPQPVVRTKDANGSTVFASPNVAVVVPVLAIETTGPADINVNRTATFVINLKNMGETTAHDIKLRTVLPNGVDLTATSHRGVNDNGIISFEVGDLRAKKATQIRIDVTPRQRGTVELISSATITSRLTSALNVRQPQLKIATQTTQETLYGKTVPLKIIVTNTGDGTADDVIVTPQLPSSLTNQNPAQPIPVGTLQPGQSKVVPYSIPATQTGEIEIIFKADTASGEHTTAKTKIVVRRPMLKTEVVGPNVTFLDRENIYELRVSNPGDADVKDVEVFCALASGLQVTVLGSKANFDRKKNLLQTKIALLPAGATEILRFKAKAVGGGQQLQEVLARTKDGLSSTQQHITKVMTRANLSVAIGTRQGTAEVEESTTIDIAVVNGGSALAENVEVRVVLPPALKGVIGEAYDIQNNEVRFSAATIEPQKRMILSFQATSQVAGDHRFKVIVVPSDGSAPLSLEGGAFFFDSRDLDEGVATQPGTDGQSSRR